MSARRVVSLGVLLLVSSLAGGRAAEPDPEVAYAERVLKEAGVAADGPGLLAYFKARTLSANDLDRLAATVRKLGDNDFETREKASHDLAAAGRPAIHFLRNALTDSDLEIARRSRLCLEEIQAMPTAALMAAAARVLADRNPAGATATLLGYLPCNDEDVVEESLFAALRRTGLRDGKPQPAVTEALGDKLAIRRAAAAQVQGRSTSVADRRPVARLLADADPRVRFEAAAALTRSGERSAVPVLIAQLTDGPASIAWQAEEFLARLAGDDAPAFGLGSTDEEHRLARAAWDKWWAVNGDKVDLTRLKNEEPLLGLTLISEYDGHAQGGRVYEQGKDGKDRWIILGLSGPNDVQPLPGGRVLIAERNANRITERDRKGNILWQHMDQQSPIACQRLPGGNTLIASFGELYEVTTAGKKVHTLPGSFRHAVRLRNGHILYVTSDGHVTELDETWKQIRTAQPEKHAGGAGYWASVELLPNGRLLVALGGQSRVVEMDWTGKVHWEITQPNCVFASRLQNGNTLVSCFENRAVVEVDRTGREVHKTTLQGRPFAVRRY